MSTIFLICATIGCTVLLLQLVLSLFGLMGDHLATDLADPGDMSGMGHHAGPFTHDTGGHTHATGHHSTSGDHTGDVDDGAAGTDDHHGFRLAGLITFQTVVAFLAFFGLGGLASLEANHEPAAAVAIGTMLGLGSMVILSYLLQTFHRLQQDGTVHLRRAVGKTGQVYLRVPADGQGEGKITVILQGRTIELKARSNGPAIPNGASVVICDFYDSQTVIVQAQTQPTSESSVAAADVRPSL